MIVTSMLLRSLCKNLTFTGWPITSWSSWLTNCRVLYYDFSSLCLLSFSFIPNSIMCSYAVHSLFSALKTLCTTVFHVRIWTSSLVKSCASSFKFLMVQLGQVVTELHTVVVHHVVKSFSFIRLALILSEKKSSLVSWIMPWNLSLIPIFRQCLFQSL